MKCFLLLISTLTVVHSRPQQPQQSDPKVELEKQTIVELKPNQVDRNALISHRKLEANTKEILDKIAEINKKQGLVEPRKQKPNYFQFPFSYSRSQEGSNHDRQSSDFRFTTNPFSNPIFEYLEREKQDTDDSYQTRYDLTNNRQSQEHDNQQGYEMSMIHPNAEVTEADVIPGQYIKRKIVHQQTFVIPNPNLMAPQTGILPPSLPQNLPQYQAAYVPLSPVIYADKDNDGNYTNDNAILSSLEKQTIDNIRNIVSNTQMQHSQPSPIYSNPYQYLAANAYQYPSGNVPTQPQYGILPQSNSLGQIPHNYQIYGPFSVPDSHKGRQNWNWPGATYFPIHIRDPFIQMYNAITSMIEYGPGAGTTNPCAGRPTRNKNKNEFLLREAKTTDATIEKTEINVDFDDSTTPQIIINSLDDKNHSSYLNIENIDIGNNKDNTMSLTVSLKPKDRTGKEGEAIKKIWDHIRESGKSSALVSNTRTNSKVSEGSQKDLRPSSVAKPTQNKQQPVISPPIRDPTHQTEEFGDEEEEKSEEIISNDGNKKLFSRDNTGSGVFIHKLKVRKGGVAIAGPGGIATAGSGGTAIVGPNGVAYTHPDSLAIAGSGTKVVAVDPTINLGDIINSTSVNKTRVNSFPPSRVGKVVAVGPVIYYNKG